MAERIPGPSLLFELFASGQRVRTLINAAMSTAPLRPDEYAVYSVLVDQGPSGPTAMARAVGMPPTTMSHYVRAMLERQHAIQERDPRDGRALRLTLTRRGRRAHAESAAAFERANARFLAALPLRDEVARSVLRRIGAAADEAAADLSSAALRNAG